MADPLHGEGNTDFFAVPIHRAIPKLTTVHINLDFGQLLEIPLDQSFRERIFDIALYRAAQRPGAVILVTASLIENPLFGVVGNGYLEPLGVQMLCGRRAQTLKPIPSVGQQ